MKRSMTLLAVAAMLLMAGCGAPAKGTQMAAKPSPSASGATAGWQTYTEPAWGYRIAMPADWHEVASGEITPAQFKHFSNQNVTDVSSLSGLDSNGMMLTVIVSNVNGGCPGTQPPAGWSASTVPAVAIDIDGYSSVVSGVHTQVGTWSVQAIAAKGKYCYSLVGMTLSHDAQVRWTPTFEQMLSTFRFGTPVAPPF